MKSYTHILSLILSAAFLFQACSYLDVVPDETPDEKDAFQNPTMAERYLYSCYSFLPNPRHETASLDLMTADEVVTPWEHETFANFPKGNYNASEPVISYWNTLFGGIRRCYILLENIDAVPNMTEANLRIYKGGGEIPDRLLPFPAFEELRSDSAYQGRHVHRYGQGGLPRAGQLRRMCAVDL